VESEVVLLNKLPKCYLHWRLVKTTASGNAIFTGSSLNQLLEERGSKTTASEIPLSLALSALKTPVQITLELSL
jgi:hypothetical protein